MRPAALLMVSALLGACSGDPASAPVPADAATPADAGTSLPAPDAGRAADAGSSLDAATPPPCDSVGTQTTDLAAYEALLPCLRSPETLDAKRAAVTRFVGAVEGRDGFPIVAGTDAVFVFVRDAAFGDPGPLPQEVLEPIRVAGDFNEWSTTGPSLVREEAEFFHARVPVGDPSGRRYKFAAPTAQSALLWFADPLARRFDYDPNGRISILRGEANRSHLERIRGVHATQLDVDRWIDLYLPPGYEQSSARYPVLYMHDGLNLFDPSAAWGGWRVDDTADQTLAASEARPFLVVAIPQNANRIGEYTHVADDWGEGPAGGQGALYLDFLVRELKPLVDARYRTEPGRASTGILGSSLGGLISYYAGLQHPEVFGLVGGMSSTFDWGAPDTLIARYQATSDLATREQIFYLDSGGGSPAGGGCLFDGADDSSDNYCETLDLRGVLLAQGVPAASVSYRFEPGAPHNETAWAERMAGVLRLFFPP